MTDNIGFTLARLLRIGVDMHMSDRYLPVIICCVFLLAVAGRAQEKQKPEPVWDDTEAHGPSHWGELKPDFASCMNGHHQSPIDIRNPQKADLPSIQFDYKPAPLDIIDNAHTIRVLS